jgi:hypothetical protein
MPKKTIVSVILILLLGGAVFAAYKYGLVNLSDNQPVEFAGNVESIENNTIFASGYFLENGLPIPGNEDEAINVEISLDSNTTLTRLAIKIPAGTGSFNIDELEKSESATDLATITADSAEHVVGLEATLERGRSGNKFIAKRLYFRVPIFEQNSDED